MTIRQRWELWATAILILASRIPFLFDGYGSEEDAWALPMVAERIGTTGIYEVSRLPGHPFQELVYSSIWNSGPLGYILLTLCISTLGMIAFQRALQQLEIKTSALVALGIAITPMVYINSTNDMDYTWAMGLELMAFWCVVNKRVWQAGLLIAAAVGCRITSGAMLVPLAILLFSISSSEEKKKNIILLAAVTLLGSLLIFSPVIATYGPAFFTYYEHFPIPGFAKNFYKGTLAVWGLPGLLALVGVGVFSLLKRKVSSPVVYHGTDITREILLVCSAVILLYSISFAQMPLKAAFMIPLIPFVWLATVILLTERAFKLFFGMLLVSAFSFGVNLSDPLRGSKESAFAWHKEIGGQRIVFDLLEGPVRADQTKRQQRTAYAQSVLQVTDTITSPTVVVAGWWLADILVLQRAKENKQVEFRYYTEEKDLKRFATEKRRVYYLPEQDVFNDMRYKGQFTRRYAIPLPQ